MFKQQVFIEWLPRTRHWDRYWPCILISRMQSEGRSLWNKEKVLIYHERRETRNLWKQTAMYFTLLCQILSVKVLSPQKHSITLKTALRLSSWHHCVLKRTVLHFTGEQLLPPRPNLCECGAWHILIVLHVPGHRNCSREDSCPAAVSHPTSCHRD